MRIFNLSYIFQFHCCIIQSSQVLDYRVVASSSTAVKQDYNEYMWTMRKEFIEPDPIVNDSVSTVVRENISNLGRELGNYHKVDSPE